MLAITELGSQTLLYQETMQGNAKKREDIYTFIHSPQQLCVSEGRSTALLFFYFILQRSSRAMGSSLSFREAIRGVFQVVLYITLCFTAVTSEDNWITVKKVTPDPVFVAVGQTLKLRLDIENLQVEEWNTTAFWVRTSDYDTFDSNEQELQLLRRVGSNSEEYCSYNKTRVSREGQVDLLLSGVTLADSGIYRCKFRRPPGGWSIWIHYNVIVEEEDANFQYDVPQIVYVARGDTLKLKPNLQDSMVSSYGKNYEKFWDYSSSLTSKQEEEVRIIGLTETTLENVDTRASLGENGTTLVLRNTTLNDSGVYHLRMTKSLSKTAIHKDFNVVVEDKPIASMSCPSTVRLSEGENFFCLCEDASSTDVPGQASWLQNGQPVKHSRRFHEQELFLKNVTVDEAGFYTCQVRHYAIMVNLSLQVFVFPAEQPMKGDKSTAKFPHWYYLAGSLAAGLLLGIVVVLLIKSFCRRCRKTKDQYVDVRSVDLELDVTSQYQDMDRNRPEYQMPAWSSAPQYEIPDISNGVYEAMNGRMLRPNQETNHGRFPRQHEVAMTPDGYTDLDHRVRVDSHPYQGLNPNRFPGNRV